MFSIMIPVYKRKKVFLEVIKSISRLNNSLINEVTCVIEPTEDLEYITELICRFNSNSNIKINMVVNEKILGMVANWNKCLRIAKSQYVIINHDDDFLNRNILDIYSDIFRKEPELALIGTDKIITSQFNIRNVMKKVYNLFMPTKYEIYTPQTIDDFIIAGHYFVCSSVAFNLKLLDSVKHGFSEKYQYSTDEELWTRVLTEFKISKVHRYVVAMTKNDENYETYTWYKPDFIIQFKAIYKDLYEYSSKSERVRGVLDERLAKILNRVNRAVNEKGNKEPLEESCSNYKVN